MDVKDLIKWLILCMRLDRRSIHSKGLFVVFILSMNVLTAVSWNSKSAVSSNDGFEFSPRGESFGAMVMGAFGGLLNGVIDYFKNNGYLGDVRYNLTGFYGIRQVSADGAAETETGYYHNRYPAPETNRSLNGIAEMLSDGVIDAFGWRRNGVGRTFGRPLKKLTMAMIPLAFKLGAASTWMVVTAILAFKSVLIGLALLIFKVAAIVAKIYSLAGNHDHGHHGWSPPHPQKEIHLHIHNSPHQGHHETYSEPWSREGDQHIAGSSNLHIAANGNKFGPQTINTPYGNYVRVGPPVGGAYK